MSAKPRDLLKTRVQRIAEVYMALHEQRGDFDRQIVSFGGDLAVDATNTKFDVAAFECVVNGQLVNGAAAAAQNVPAGASTTSGQFRKVSVASDATGTVSTIVGAASTTTQADAPKPAAPAGQILLGWIEVPASFTPGTTALTAAMLKKEPYWDTAHPLPPIPRS